MTLTNYWWLLIWLVLVGGLLVVVVPKKPVQVLDKTEYRWSWGASLLLACPYVIWAATRVNFGDTEVYRKMSIWRNTEKIRDLQFWQQHSRHLSAIMINYFSF